MKKIKLVVIGGGSSYTPELVDGIIKRKNVLPIKELILVDIHAGKEKVSINCDLANRMLKKVQMDVKISYTLNRKEALKGADFVIIQFRVGGLTARHQDEKIPLKYNVIGQETTGPGGFAKAIRTIPVMLSICKDMEELCPNAWLINFTNPSGIITEAVHKYSKVKCIGLCNVPINMQYDICEKLNVDIKRVHCRFIGLNHLSFIKTVYLDGKDVTNELLKSKKANKNIVKNIKHIDSSEIFETSLGLIPSPYLQYFYHEDKMLKEEKENINNGLGTRAQQVMKIEKRLFDIYKNKNLNEKPKELSKRGGSRYSEAAIALVDSIWNNKSDIHVVNVANNGSILDLQNDSVIETNCIINSEGAVPMSNGNLPKNIKGLVQQVDTYEYLTIEAAVKGKIDKALMALVNNPLVHSVSQAENILEDILKAHKKYLYNFFKEGNEVCTL